jgi:hypothetical protein
MAGVVDQDVDRNAPVTEARMESNNCRDIGKINLLNNDLDAVLLAQYFSEFLQPFEPARHQNQRMTFPGILAGELLAEATGRAGDENPRCGRIWSG